MAVAAAAAAAAAAATAAATLECFPTLSILTRPHSLFSPLSRVLSTADLVNKLKSEPASSATLLSVYVEAFRTRWSKPASLAPAKQELLELIFLVAGLLPEHLETRA